jgi:mRNA interferase RelE/StbE
VASYSVRIKRSAAKELQGLPLKERRRLVQRIESLATDPRPPGHERLSGEEKYRVRQGDYRILYEIVDRELIVIVAIHGPLGGTVKRIGMIALGLLVGCSTPDNAEEPSDAGTANAQLADGLPAAEEGDDWRRLFDGQRLEGWIERGGATWRVDDDAVTPASPGPGFLTTSESFGDFQLSLEFWTDTIANGGVFLRMPADGEVTQFNSIEVNIFDASPEWPTGSVNQIQRHDPESTIGRWNSYDITAEGDRVVVVLNGDTTVDARVPDRLASGPIGLQILGEGEIRYRDVRIRER